MSSKYFLLSVFFLTAGAQVDPLTVYGEPGSDPAFEPIPGPDPRSVQCVRTPPSVTTPKKAGGNGFLITITGNPQKYMPGESYSVNLISDKLSFTEQKKFTGFLLVVEPKNSKRAADGSGRQPDVGMFELFGDALVKFSETCPNAVMMTTNIPKASIQAMWRAPAPGSGCVLFKATVVEQRDEWRMDDDGLTKELCEEEQESHDEQPEILEECCACDEAKYEVTFEGLWSRHTHPKDFPHGTLTHFSDIIGASHTGDFRIWEYNAYASEGVKHVAEMGSTRKLESELKAESEKIRTIIKARGLFFPNVTSKTFAVFRVDKQHHVTSLLSMLGPSPDWIVGVSALELCLKNCSWMSEKVMNLYPWDAGTDSGVSYFSANQATEPQEKIHRITSTNPTYDKSPFYDPSGTPMKPVARLTVTRQRVYEKSCEDSATLGPEEPPFDPEKPECAVTEWTAYSPCSVTCGKGTRMRSRAYLNEYKAHQTGCLTQMVQKDMCEANCNGDVSCETHPWSEWSDCSTTCGKGFRSRQRKYKHPKARKLCAHSLEDKEPCTGVVTECKDIELIDPRCAVTQWSEWSPCTATCGKGMKMRTRLYLNPSAQSICNIEKQEKASCTAPKKDCTIDFNDAKERCMKPREVGPCRGYFPRWYYHSNRGQCLQFIYGGCRGNSNNFKRYSDCNKICEEMLKAPIGALNTGSSAPPTITDHSDQPIIDCVVTSWTDWTPCSRTCSNGRKERRRMIKLNPQNGGKPCPKKLVQRRKCKDNPPCPVDCLLTPWSEWSPCSHTCGQMAMKTRVREVKREAKNGGSSCGPKLEREYCTLAPCAYQ